MLSPDEVLSTVILVIPGFVALSIARYAWGTSRQLATFPMTVWSIFLSAIIDFGFLQISSSPLPPTSIDIVKLLSSWEGLAIYGLIILGVGVVGGLFLRFEPAVILRRLIWLKTPSQLTPGLLWDDALSIHLYQSIVVELESEILIQGYLDRFSTFDEPRELLLEKPRRVVFDKEGEPHYYDMGHSIVVPERRILSLRFLQSPAKMENKRSIRERIRQRIPRTGNSKSRPGPRVP